MNAMDPYQQNRAQPSGQRASGPVAPLAVWGATDKGREREGNEDAIYPHSGSDTFPFEPGPQNLAQKGRLLIVADGVGGAKAGREASHWAIRVAVERYYDLAGADLVADLKTAVEVANASLYQYLQTTGSQDGGCTMVAAVVRGNTLYVANVGDSRAYMVRGGQIAQLTRDHTLTQQKIDHGLIRPEQADMDPNRNVLTRSMGSGPQVQVDLFPPLQLIEGDTLLLCSDGLTDMLDDTEIARLVNGGSPKRIAQRLIAAANRSGGLDNISVVMARFGKKKAPTRSGLVDRIQHMSSRQRRILLAGIVLVAAALCAMAVLGFSMFRSPKSTPTPTPVATIATTPTATLTEPTPAPPTAQPSETLATSQATSTPAPTITPTPTRKPPTPTLTLTSSPVPEPSETAEKEENSSGNGSKPKKTPER
jgi:serine/threonine protein phosphatase PrpC